MNNFSFAGNAEPQLGIIKNHVLNGKIRAGNSYGNDPCPPKDKK